MKKKVEEGCPVEEFLSWTKDPVLTFTIPPERCVARSLQLEGRVFRGVVVCQDGKMKAQALKECDSIVAKFAECAKGKTLSVIWTCRLQAREMNACLHQYTNDEVLEVFKKQYTMEQEARQRS